MEFILAILSVLTLELSRFCCCLHELRTKRLIYVWFFLMNLWSIRTYSCIRCWNDSMNSRIIFALKFIVLNGNFATYYVRSFFSSNFNLLFFTFLTFSCLNLPLPIYSIHSEKLFFSFFVIIFYKYFSSRNVKVVLLERLLFYLNYIWNNLFIAQWFPMLKWANERNNEWNEIIFTLNKEEHH